MDITHDSLKHTTIMLVSGELDKALAAFEIATGMAAMGATVTMWFSLYGVNCLKKPKGYLSLRKWFPGKRRESPGRKTSTDTPLQGLLRILSPYGAKHLPLSQLNLFGIGPMVMERIFAKKGLPKLETMIQDAAELGIRFRICQTCVDAFALDVEEDLVVKAEIAGVSSYTLDVKNSHYNAVF